MGGLGQKNIKVGLDFNPTFFSHPMMKDGFTLASSDPEVRAFWIEHGKRSRRVAEYFGKNWRTCYINFRVLDGLKIILVDRLAPRKRLMESLDEIFSEHIDERYNKDVVESKLFGIKLSYQVGSHEFYMGYGLLHGKDDFIRCWITSIQQKRLLINYLHLCII